MISGPSTGIEAHLYAPVYSIYSPFIPSPACGEGCQCNKYLSIGLGRRLPASSGSKVNRLVVLNKHLHMVSPSSFMITAVTFKPDATAINIWAGTSRACHSFCVTFHFHLQIDLAFSDPRHYQDAEHRVHEFRSKLDHCPCDPIP